MCVGGCVCKSEDMLVKNKNRNKNDHLQFPSGRTIKRCKEDAKALRKASKGTDHYLSYNKALDVIAAQNGINMSWDKATNHIIKSAEKESEFESKELFNKIIGRVRNEQSSYKKEVLARFEHDGKIYLPDGEGKKLEVFQHKKSNRGLLISQEVQELVEADIRKMGGLENLNGYDDGNVQILYEKPNSTSHLAYEFHVNQDGVIHYFCRCMPWEGYEAELHVRGYSINYVGHGTKAVDSALHWLGFSYWHSFMTPKAM